MAANTYSTNLVGSSSQAFSATDHADFKPTGNFTVGTWVKGTGNSQFLMQSMYFGAAYGGWYVQLKSTGAIQFFSGRNNGTTHAVNWDTADSTGTVNDGNWHWVVCVWDGSYLRIYIDGTPDGSTSWANAPGYNATNYVRIGCECDTGSNTAFFAGNLDETFIVNGTAWDLATVQSYYQKVVTGATNLVAYYRFENNNNDSTAGAHTLTSIATPTFQLDVPFTGITTNYLKNYRANTGGRLSF